MCVYVFVSFNIIKIISLVVDPFFRFFFFILTFMSFFCFVLRFVSRMIMNIFLQFSYIIEIC